MHPMLNIALRSVRKAGDLIAKYYETPSNIKTNQKDDNSSHKTAAAYEISKAIIIETIHKSYPNHTIISRDSNKYGGIDQSVQWIINPLDGTVNFVKRLPHFSVSVAVKIKGRTEVTVVYDPIRNELFTATRGQGAQLNGYRLRSGGAKNLNNAILSTNFPSKIMKKYSISYMDALRKLFTKFTDFRCTGSTALDLTYVAAGRIDGYFEIGLKPWDFAAGELIAHESGALVCDFSGGYNYMITGNIIAGNPRAVKAILENIHDGIYENR